MRIGERVSGDSSAASHSTDTASNPQVSTETVAPADQSWAGRVRATVLAYIALTKPRVIEWLLVATIPVMLQADRGHVDIAVIAFTLIGGWLGAGSANTLNMVVDADIDKKMKRTERRPLARDSVPRSHALIFGLTLSVASFFWLWWTTNMLSAHLAGATIAFYVLVYTLLLKRRTSQNVVWGGAAGCMPVMIGWSGSPERKSTITSCPMRGR